MAASTSSPSSSSNVNDKDAEQGPADFLNSSIHSFAWSDVSVQVKDKKAKKTRVILHNASGVVHAGEMCALMGPSGCGKTTLLNVLSGRSAPSSSSSSLSSSKATPPPTVLVDGERMSRSDFRRVSTFIEQEDVLIGALTVRESLLFTSRLAGTSKSSSSPSSPSSSTLSARDRRRDVDTMLSALGLHDQADTLVGTPLRRGISGGQKRRVSIASQLMTKPVIVFLDEPTSGLDSAASLEVMSYLRTVARRNKLIVICSIHQPSAKTFRLFDKLMLLSGGKTHYFGALEGVDGYYASVAREPIPSFANPADHLLDTLNVDFSSDKASALKRLDRLQKAWDGSRQAKLVRDEIFAQKRRGRSTHHPSTPHHDQVVVKKPNRLGIIVILCHRSFIKSYRDAMAYGIRMVMYPALGLMMGTIWLRLSPTQTSIQPLTTAIFFASAFISFMSVCYVPAFLEDRLLFTKERSNGLYGPIEFVVSNFLVGLPFLLLMSLVYSSILYWLSNFQPTPLAFFYWVLWSFLDILTAESVVVFVASLVPNFVAALCAIAFANALWMCISDFMIPTSSLNAFYKYVFYYWDYLNYTFQGLMINEFQHRVYSCGEGCRCMFESVLAERCEIDGGAVLDHYGFQAGHTARLAGYVLAVALGFRLATCVILLSMKR